MNQSWLQIKKNVKSGEVVQGFGKKVSSLIDNYLHQYRNWTKQSRDGNGPWVVEPVYLSIVERKRNAKLNNFKEAAGPELKTNGELMDTKPSKFIAELSNQLKDAAIEQANWNHATIQYERLQEDMRAFRGQHA
ncbi:hypothetical protein ACH5RR_032802 [Cinchona calisaya]|uniref:Uncharacterized protein n=1 Tax=Cinchona calisaya TaxID=153742 RepID=A0ABD2YMP1_9GENT